MPDLVLTLIGPDHPGIVEAIAEPIARHGGNWLESRMCRLGGEFAGILRIHVEAGREQELLGALEEIQRDMPLVFPVHPRTRKNLDQFGLAARLASWSNLRLIEPLADGAARLLLLLVIVWLSDTFAFFTGCAVGRHRLAPALSPQYDLSKALAHVRDKAYVFSSVHDVYVLLASPRIAHSFANAPRPQMAFADKFTLCAR